MNQEKILHFIWEHQYFRQEGLRTTCGMKLDIHSPGKSHFHSGPDFFNARISFDSLIQAGNVEVHRRSSDWDRHGHQNDPAYNNVILHVVTQSDAQVFTCEGRRVPELVLRIPPSILALYRSLNSGEFSLHCRAYIHRITPIRLKTWLTVLEAERMRMKGSHIRELYLKGGGDWETCLYLSLASGFGLPVNALPFEMTARSVPGSVLSNCRSNLPELEAIFFGQAGFLEQAENCGPYHTFLQGVYAHLRRKLAPPLVQSHLWKFLRLRPASFPTLRIAMFASLVHAHFPFLESFLNAATLAETEQLLAVKASPYWDDHYIFARPSTIREKRLGHQGRIQIMINAITPFLITFGQYRNSENISQKGIRMIQELGAEKNQILKMWASCGIRPLNAFESQALIHLYTRYCKQRRCLECQIGVNLFRDLANE
jgi:hypothetical protein